MAEKRTYRELVLSAVCSEKPDNVCKSELPKSKVP